MEEVIRIVKQEIEREQRGLRSDESYLEDYRSYYQQALMAVDRRKEHISALEAGLKKLEGDK